MLPCSVVSTYVYDYMVLLLSQVLEQRQKQELAKLESDFEEEKHQHINVTLLDLKTKFDKAKDELLSKHDDQLEQLMLENANMTEVQFEQKKAELLNEQQMELSDLEQKYGRDCKHIETITRADLEAKHARVKLDMRERHYQVQSCTCISK